MRKLAVVKNVNTVVGAAAELSLVPHGTGTLPGQSQRSVNMLNLRPCGHSPLLTFSLVNNFRFRTKLNGANLKYWLCYLPLILTLIELGTTILDIRIDPVRSWSALIFALVIYRSIAAVNILKLFATLSLLVEQLPIVAERFLRLRVLAVEVAFIRK